MINKYKKKDKKTKVSPGRKILMDGIDVVRKPDGFGVTLVDLSAAKTFIEQYRKEKNVSIAYIHLIIKASALALKKHPWVNYMLNGYKVIEPSTIDIGVSVAGEENVAPVVVIREADTKPLNVIAEEFKNKANEAREEERENLKKLNLIGKLIPFHFIRRKIIKLFFNNWKVRRKLVGTFQVTTLSSKAMEFFFPAVISTTALLGVGGVKRRCIGVRDKIELRPSVYLSIQIDHRMLDGKKGIDFLKEIKRLLENPRELSD